MAILAEHMTRLCGEIQTMRRTRTVLKDELENKMRERRTAVSQMQANFANAHA
jgi:heme exporter protein D